MPGASSRRNGKLLAIKVKECWARHFAGDGGARVVVRNGVANGANAGWCGGYGLAGNGLCRKMAGLAMKMVGETQTLNLSFRAPG